MVSLFKFKNTLEKQNSLQERKFAAGENQKRLWKIKIRLYKTNKRRQWVGAFWFQNKINEEDGKPNIKKDLVALDAAGFFFFPNMPPECQFFEKFLTYILWIKKKGVMNNDTRTDSVSIIFKKKYEKANQFEKLEGR